MCKPRKQKEKEFNTYFNQVLKSEIAKCRYTMHRVSVLTGLNRTSIIERIKHNRTWSFYDAVIITNFLGIQRKEVTKNIGKSRR